MDFQCTAPALISLRITSSFLPHSQGPTQGGGGRSHTQILYKLNEAIGPYKPILFFYPLTSPSLCKRVPSVWWLRSMSALKPLCQWTHPRMSPLGFCCQISHWPTRKPVTPLICPFETWLTFFIRQEGRRSYPHLQ